MKMVQTRSLGKKPLPGDRQGTLGATTEGDSERVSGDRMLNRRTSVNKNATAEHISGRSFSRSEIIGDGSCLFRSVSMYMYGHQHSHKSLRETALKYIRKNWSELQNYVLIEDEMMRNLDNYYAYMQKTTSYGTSLEILALSETQELNFHIYHKQRRTKIKKVTLKGQPTIINKKQHTRTIHLLLSGRPDEGHFELLTPEKSPEPENTNKSQESHQRPQTPPVEGAAQEFHPALTQAGRPRTRMKWTSSMNETIMRLFYRVTQLETDMIGYRQKLHLQFCREYPELQISEQRVADQYRVILRNKLIPEARLNIIKSEVKNYLLPINNELNVTISSATSIAETPEEQPTNNSKDQKQEDNQNNENVQLYQILDVQMKKSVLEYCGTDPLSRPLLPKLKTSKKLAILLNIMNNKILPDIVLEIDSLEYLHMIIYCAALSITKSMGVKLPTRNGALGSLAGQRAPAWEKRLQNKINCLRKDIGRLTEYVNGIRTKRLEKVVELIIQRTRVHSHQDQENITPIQCLDTLKQKVSVLAGRLRRYKASNERKRDNALFAKSEKGFYRSLNKNTEGNNTEYPSKEMVEHFWTEQLSTPATSNPNANWIEEENKNAREYNQMKCNPFTTKEIDNTLKTLHNWKAPGLDGIHNYWLKKLRATHENLALCLNNLMQEPQSMPSFLTQGVTYLLPKDRNNMFDPSKYRPITCLPTLYKLITACITSRISTHCEDNKIISIQQKGCAKDSMGCKEQLIIDSVICNQAYSKQRNLFMAYIDYKKAFDTMPHDWLIRILKIYNIDPSIIHFLEHAMSTWHTTIHLSDPNAFIKSNPLPIKRGIYQGDSLSPLWFCIAMNPLSNLLNSTGYGFSINKNIREKFKLNHLLYMDDLKLMAATKNELDQMLNIVEHFSTDIAMQFGLDKCRTISIKKGRIQEDVFEMHNGEYIEAMRQGDTYKYLGIKQGQRINHRVMKDELTCEFTRRIRQLLKSKLNSKNLFKAINTYACSVLGYSFGIVGWSDTEISNLQRKIRTLLTKAKKHHPRSAIERTTIPRHLGGRGLTDISKQLDQQIANLRSYFQQKARTSDLHRLICDVDNFTPLQLKKQQVLTHHESVDVKLQSWREKPLHGRHLNEVGQDYVDYKASNYWLASGGMFPETEGFLVAIQDQVVPTRNYLKYITRDASVKNDSCRYGCRESETIQHVTGGCQMFAASEYKLRHDALAKILHQELAEKLQLRQEPRVPYYIYNPESILENHSYKLYWDRTVLTDQTNDHNRPDLILVDKSARSTTLIEVAIPNSHNLCRKHTEKIEKYRNLEEQIRRQWGMKTVRTLPFIMSTTGVIPKNLLQNIKELGLNERLFRVMQKAVLLAISRVVRKFMGCSQIHHHVPNTTERAPPKLNPCDM